MASRNMSHQAYTLERDVAKVFLHCTGAATSAPTSIKSNGATISRTGSGAYTITLSDQWAGLLNFSAFVLDGNATTRNWLVVPTAQTVASTKTITIKTFTSASAAAPALGDLPTDVKLYVEITLSNTSQKPSGF